MSDGRFTCGRCKQITYLGWSSLSGHYCGFCRRFICRDCWVVPALACFDCADLSEDRVGVVAARLRLQELRRVRRQVVELNAAEASSEGGSAALRSSKRGLLAIKFADQFAEVARALRDVSASEEAAAEQLRASLEAEARRAQDAFGWAPVRTDPPPPNALPANPAPGTTVRAQPSWRRSMRLSIAAGVAVVVLAVLIGLGARPTGPGTTDAEALRSVDGQVAAGGPSQLPGPVSTSSAGAPQRRVVTFDSVVTKRTPPGWTVSGGTAQVVPFPNPVDRSLRIAVTDGTAVACSPVARLDAGRISLDLHIGDGAAAVVATRSGAQDASLHIGRGGVARIKPGGAVLGPPVAARRWHQIAIERTFVDGETFVAVVLDRVAGDVERPAIPGSRASGAELPEEVCVSVRARARGEVHVDNLVIDG